MNGKYFLDKSNPPVNQHLVSHCRESSAGSELLAVGTDQPEGTNLSSDTQLDHERWLQSTWCYLLWGSSSIRHFFKHFIYHHSSVSHFNFCLPELFLALWEKIETSRNSNGTKSNISMFQMCKNEVQSWILCQHNCTRISSLTESGCLLFDFKFFFIFGQSHLRSSYISFSRFLLTGLLRLIVFPVLIDKATSPATL